MSGRVIAVYLRRVEQTAEALEQVCHGDVITDAQIEALVNAVSAQADAIQALGRAVLGEGRQP